MLSNFRFPQPFDSFKASEHPGFEYYYYMCRDFVHWRIKKTLLLEDSKVEDIVQEVFTNLWDRRAGIKDESHLFKFVALTTRNLCYNWRRNENSRRQAEQGWAMGRELDSVLDPREEAAAIDEMVTAILKRLPPRRRMAVWLRYIKGLSVKKVAEDMDLRPQTIRNQINKAIKSVPKGDSAEKSPEK